MFNQAEDDTPTLRRIALLVLRARQDETPGAVRDLLDAITSVIENVKRSIALDSCADQSDLVRLRKLVSRLPRGNGDPRSAAEIVRWSVMTELRELVTRLVPVMPRRSRTAVELRP